ncbi:MAG: phosphoribosylanthranilate isomerase [Pseudomonadota bacterium]
MSDIAVKICGLRKPEHVKAAVDAGARYVGFVFYPKSPRAVTLDAARELAASVPPGVAKVALTVDADDAFLDALTATVPLDVLQLHGSETPDRVAAVRERYGLPVMKAVGVACEADLSQLDRFGTVADQILVDAKPSRDSKLPGGNGIPFDWRLIADRRWPVPWMLAGGLTPENVVEALRLTGAKQVDLSSGVESEPGIKDPAKIYAFMRALKVGQPALH